MLFYKHFSSFKIEGAMNFLSRFIIIEELAEVPG